MINYLSNLNNWKIRDIKATQQISRIKISISSDKCVMLWHRNHGSNSRRAFLHFVKLQCTFFPNSQKKKKNCVLKCFWISAPY